MYVNLFLRPVAALKRIRILGQPPSSFRLHGVLKYRHSIRSLQEERNIQAERYDLNVLLCRQSLLKRRIFSGLFFAPCVSHPSSRPPRSICLLNESNKANYIVDTHLVSSLLYSQYDSWPSHLSRQLKTTSDFQSGSHSQSRSSVCKMPISRSW